MFPMISSYRIPRALTGLYNSDEGGTQNYDLLVLGNTLRYQYFVKLDPRDTYCVRITKQRCLDQINHMVDHCQDKRSASDLANPSGVWFQYAHL